MNKHELVSHVAAGIPMIRAEAERLVGVVFSAIADAMVRGEPVTIAGFGKFATRSRVESTPEPAIRPPTGVAAARRACHHSRSAGAGTFVADTSIRDRIRSSCMRRNTLRPSTHQSAPRHNSSRAPRRETQVRAAALKSKRKPLLTAYGVGHPAAQSRAQIQLVGAVSCATYSHIVQSPSCQSRHGLESSSRFRDTPKNISPCGSCRTQVAKQHTHS